MTTRYIFLVAVLISVVGLSALTTEANYSKRVVEPRQPLEVDTSCNVIGISVSSEILRMLEFQGEKYDMAKMYTIEYNNYRMKLMNEVKRYEYLLKGPQNMIDSSMKDHYQMQLDRTYLRLQDNWKTYSLKMASMMRDDQIRRWNVIVGEYCSIQ